MRIVADENMPLIPDLFGSLAEVTLLPGRQIQAQDLVGVDALLVRSVTKITAELLAQSSLSFIGSATIGTDHLNPALLAERGVQWANAPGCNADAVVQYVLAALVGLWQRGRLQPVGKTAAVIGVGQVGRRVARVLEALGFEVWLNDPPRAAVEGPEAFVSLHQALSADLVCLHAPLVTSGPYPSQHLLGADELAQLRFGAVLLNAGRGEVVDNLALSRLLTQRDDLTVVLDVWEHEPLIPPLLLQQVQLATPHIAGYSLDGKVKGSLMVYQACCHHFGWPLTVPQGRLPPLPITQVQVSAEAKHERWSVLAALLPLTYDPWLDDARLRQALHQSKTHREAQFDLLRKNYPLRRECAALSVQGPDWVQDFGFTRLPLESTP